MREAGIEVLIDIRERAQSRRKGFSKTALSEALADAGIEYIHLRELGDPKQGRDAARRGDWKEFRRVFNGVLRSNSAKEGIDRISSIASGRSVCLLCYERDEKTCHRKIVSEIVESRLCTKTRHLGVRRVERAAA
ncbi:DUF488 family protein [Pyruvatibacter mobilis]|uniref:DUF488 domain-containing protein n=1 Tax=Pyruvatibacter mobilis TaxID=1712261 RepID=UPI003D0D695B